MYVRLFKRLLDFVLALLGVIVLSPFFLVLMVVIIIDSKGPIFFLQDRIGRNKSIFKIIKFRTMRVDAPKDIPTHLLKNPEKHITRVGRFLRTTSLDEMPQIFNILIGQMAVVGPRPALWNQDDLIAERDKYRGKHGLSPNELRPGLTGWAQINGRDELEIPIKARLDGEYAKKVSFLFDLGCVMGTVVSIFSHRGIVEGGTGALYDQVDDSQVKP